MLVHNHPSGDPRPSPEDMTMTQKVAEAAQVVGLQCVDHVIVTAEDYSSFLDLALL